MIILDRHNYVLMSLSSQLLYTDDLILLAETEVELCVRHACVRALVPSSGNNGT